MTGQHPDLLNNPQQIGSQLLARTEKFQVNNHILVVISSRVVLRYDVSPLTPRCCHCIGKPAQRNSFFIVLSCYPLLVTTNLTVYGHPPTLQCVGLLASYLTRCQFRTDFGVSSLYNSGSKMSLVVWSRASPVSIK